LRIAITGGSGSLGRALITRLVEDGADRIVAFSRDEQKRLALGRDFGWHPGFRHMAGDVLDRDRLVDIFHGCEVVVHGAARKVVSAMPDEAEELRKTNIEGTVNVIEACRAAGVGKLICVSSDKAVHPENAYGVSKAMMEHLAINANARALPRGLRIGLVRYGNVLGSTGSVVPVWRKALEQRQAITVSDPSMTRFWITMSQAVDLILTAISNLRGGEIVVPKIPAADIGTLLEALTREFIDAEGLPADYTPDTRITGFRPGGEKRHEELLAPAEVGRTRLRNGVYVVAPYQHDDMWDAKPWVGERIPDDTVYRSDVWEPRLDPDQMRFLIRGIV